MIRKWRNQKETPTPYTEMGKQFKMQRTRCYTKKTYLKMGEKLFYQYRSRYEYDFAHQENMSMQ